MALLLSVLGLTLFRYFGVSRWSIFDGVLVLVSLIFVVWGGKGYRRAHLNDRRLGEILAADPGLSNVI